MMKDTEFSRFINVHSTSKSSRNWETPKEKNQLTLTMHFCLENTYVCSATARQAM
jgi:hypothetical protein